MIGASIETTLLYRSTDGARLEHARIRIGDAGGVADGTIVGSYAQRPLRVRHETTCDSSRAVRAVNVEAIAAGREVVSLVSDDGGIWRRVDGAILDVPLFDCFDVAIGLTPVPTGLTIRRLALEAGESRIVRVAEIAVPSLVIALVEQRFTALEVGSDFSRYRVEHYDSGVRHELRTDTDGTVIEDDAGFTRLWPVASGEAIDDGDPAR